VGGFVLVEQHQGGGRGKWGEQCRARPGGQTRRSVAQRAPGRRALLVRHPRVEPHDAVDLCESLSPLCDGLDVGGDHQRGPLRRLQPLEQPLLTAGADQELGLGRGQRARAASGRRDYAGVRAPRRRQERGAGRPDRREALCRDPADELELRRRQHGLGIDEAGERLELRISAVAQGHDHADPCRAPQRRSCALPGGKRPAVGNAIRERMANRGVEDDVRDGHVSEREAGSTEGGLK